MGIFSRRRRAPDPDAVLRPLPDDLPKDDLFAAPLRIDRLEVLPIEELDDGRVRVSFRARVRDAEGKPCPDFAVDAEVSGPERTAAGQGTTDLMGRIRFRMAGPPGTYRIRITDVAAGAMPWDRDASHAQATTTV